MIKINSKLYSPETPQQAHATQWSICVSDLEALLSSPTSWKVGRPADATASPGRAGKVYTLSLKRPQLFLRRLKPHGRQ